MIMKDTSPAPEKPYLFALPQELRDLIYEFACQSTTALIHGVTHKSLFRHSSHSDIDPKIGVTISASNVGMLQVCRQMRSEAESIYYRNTVFAFSSPSACVAWIKEYMSPQHLRHVRTLRIGGSLTRLLFRVLKRTTDAKCRQSYARRIQAEALHVVTTVNEALRGVSQLSPPPGALQAMALDKNWELVWTATPGEVEMPSHDFAK